MTILERLGLHRRELRAWAMYDWANSAMVTTIVTAVFPIYFAKVAAADLAPALATKRLADATTIGLVIIAVLSPILGAIADRAGVKKRLLGLSLIIGVVAVGLMFFIERGDWVLAAGLFVVANIAVNASFVCLRLASCPTSRRRRRWTGSRPRATPWGTSAAGCCSR